MSKASQQPAPDDPFAEFRPSIVTGEQLKELDRRTIFDFGIPGITLMERAAVETVRVIEQVGASSYRSAFVIAGPGNNGGDGAAVARMLALKGWRVALFAYGDENKRSEDAALNMTLAAKAGVIRVDEADVVADEAERADIIVDALFGIGFRGELPDAAAELLETIAERVGDSSRRSETLTFAIDIVSGVDASTGSADDRSLHVDHTVTYGAKKWGHVLEEGRRRSGHVHCVDIGIPPFYFDELSSDAAIEFDRLLARRCFAPLDPGGHKGSSGTLQVHAGSADMPGAAVLCCHAAIRSGAGLVSLSINGGGGAWPSGQLPEIVSGARSSDACLFGPGMGNTQSTVDALVKILEEPGDGGTLVIDADGLAALKQIDAARIQSKRELILTPHPKELARLLDVELGEVLSDLPGAATRAAELYGAIVVAKTAGAIVAHPDRRLIYIAGTTAGLATAGSGDVLAGVIAALALRHPARISASLGAWIHQRAGAHASATASGTSLIASDIIRALPAVFKELERPE